MRKPLYDKKVLKERGLVTKGFCLPYNPKADTTNIRIVAPVSRKGSFRLPRMVVSLLKGKGSKGDYLYSYSVVI